MILPSWFGRTDPGKFAKHIRFSPSPTITFDDSQFGKHPPDASFKHIDAKYPGVVIEVSYSQKKRGLPCLADGYILGSDAEIRAVVGLDLDYRGKMATLSIWRPRTEVNAAGEKELVVHQTLSDQKVRSEDGTPVDNPQHGLHLHLEDFALKAFAGGEVVWDEEIFISAKDLSDTSVTPSGVIWRPGLAQSTKLSILGLGSDVARAHRLMSSMRMVSANSKRTWTEGRAEQDDSSYLESSGSIG